MSSEQFFYLGLFTALVLLIIISVIKTSRKKNLCTSFRGKLDERQQQVKGNGYKYGFFAIMISNVLYAFITTLTEKPVISPLIGIFSSIFIGVGVFACYCIINDGYFGFDHNPKPLIVLMVATVLLNSINFIRHLFIGDLFSDDINMIPMLCSLLFIVILITMFIKKIQSGNGENM